MKRHFLLFAFVGMSVSLALQATSAAADDDPGLVSPAFKPAAPAAADDWGKMIGKWDAEYTSIAPDGKEYKGKAEWSWFYVLDGTAVQDVWISPPRGTEAGKDGRYFGTDLRIFNPRSGKWQVVFADNRSGKYQKYDAGRENGKMVMRLPGEPNKRRITFVSITDRHVDWMQEESGDGGKTWRVMLRIRGTRRGK